MKLASVLVLAAVAFVAVLGSSGEAPEERSNESSELDIPELPNFQEIQDTYAEITKGIQEIADTYADDSSIPEDLQAKLVSLNAKSVFLKATIEKFFPSAWNIQGWVTEGKALFEEQALIRERMVKEWQDLVQKYYPNNALIDMIGGINSFEMPPDVQTFIDETYQTVSETVQQLMSGGGSNTTSGTPDIPGIISTIKEKLQGLMSGAKAYIPSPEKMSGFFKDAGELWQKQAVDRNGMYPPWEELTEEMFPTSPDSDDTTAPPDTSSDKRDQLMISRSEARKVLLEKLIKKYLQN